MIKADFANNKVWKVPLNCMISKQTVQVVAIIEDGFSARKGSKKYSLYLFWHNCPLQTFQPWDLNSSFFSLRGWENFPSQLCDKLSPPHPHHSDTDPWFVNSLSVAVSHVLSLIWVCMWGGSLLKYLRAPHYSLCLSTIFNYHLSQWGLWFVLGFFF